MSFELRSSRMSFRSRKTRMTLMLRKSFRRSLEADYVVETSREQ